MKHMHTFLSFKTKTPTFQLIANYLFIKTFKKSRSIFFMNFKTNINNDCSDLIFSSHFKKIFTCKKYFINTSLSAKVIKPAQQQKVKNNRFSEEKPILIYPN